MSISFLYKNKIKEAVSITENCSETGWGTSFLADDDLNSVFRGTATTVGTTTILFNFGSAVYMDSINTVTNLSLIGNLTLRAGATSGVSSQTFTIPVNGRGTSHSYFGNYGYQYWRLDLHGVTSSGKHQINELFLGKRTLITEMPSYPVAFGIEEDSISIVSERGQRWMFSNYERENWILNFEGISNYTENALYKMYRYVRKNTQPFWMCLSPDSDPMDIKFVRFKENSFISEEVTKSVYDVTLEIERDL